MKILITGGAGFIGRNLAKTILETGGKVVVLDNFLSAPPMEEQPGLTIIHGDVEDIRGPMTLLNDVDAVVHAACVQLPECSDPENYWRGLNTHVMGTMAMLDLCRQLDVPMVYLSSVSVYGDYSISPINEDAPSRPCTPYAAGKLAGEGFCMAYQKHGWVNSTILRLSNVYGPGQHPDYHAGVIGKFIDAKLKNKPAILYGGGTDVRDFTYISDVIDAILMALESDFHGPYNVSHGIATKIKLIVDQLGLTAEYAEPRDVDNIPFRTLDTTKIRMDFGWYPRVQMPQGLRLTEQWMSKVMA